MQSDFDHYLLVPQHSSLNSRSTVKTDTRIGKIRLKHPIVASPMSTVCELEMAKAMMATGSLGFIHRYMPVNAQVSLSMFLPHPVAASIGVNGDSLERIDKLSKGADINIVTIDVAHGDTDSCMDMVKYIKSKYDIQVVSGNIVTPEAARAYYNAGADCFRVGIGSGAACTTRVVAGVGYNQLKAIREIHSEFPDIPIINDGGIRNSGDLTKVLAAGASCSFVGSLLAPAQESPAERVTKGGDRYVIYAGMASEYAEKKRIERTGERAEPIDHTISPEGEIRIIPDSGEKAETIINRLVAGLKHGMAYLGADTIERMWQRAVWTRALP